MNAVECGCVCLGALLLAVSNARAMEPVAARQAALLAGLECRREAPDPWFDATFALTALHTNRENDEANRVLVEFAELWPVDPGDKQEPRAYWAFSALARILLTHGRSGTGRLSEAADSALKRLFWDYTSVRSRPDPARPWILDGSENHDLM